MSEAPGISLLPPKNEELKKKEADVLQGENITIRLKLPDGSCDDMTLPLSREVGWLKAMLSQKLGLAYKNITLKCDNMTLLDPLSLCDHSAIQPPLAEIRVELEE